MPLSRRVLRAWHTIDRLPGVRWVKKMAAFPIGERFAAISLTAALFDPRVTFVVLLSWGGFAVALHPERARAALDRAMTATVAPAEQRPSLPDNVVVYRDDGPVALRDRARARPGRAGTGDGAAAARRRRDPRARRRSWAATPRSAVTAAGVAWLLLTLGITSASAGPRRASPGRCRRSCGSASTRRWPGWPPPTTPSRPRSR